MTRPGRVLAAVGGALLMAFLPALLGAGCGREEAAFDGAMTLFDEGKMREAADSLSRFLDRYPDGSLAAEALFQRGTIELLYLENPSAAAADFTEIARTFPRSPRAFDARRRIGELAEVRLGDNARARAEYQRLLADFPTHPGIGEVRMRLGELSFRELRFDEARAYFGPLAEGEGEAAEKAVFAVALSWATERKAAEAEAAWRGFLARFPRSSRAGEARLFLADALEQQGRWEDAIALLTEAVAAGGDRPSIEGRIARIRGRITRLGR